jgi:hypothetical protein
MSKNPEYIEAHAVPAENPSYITATAVGIHPTVVESSAPPAPPGITGINEMGAREFFGGHKWPIGLQDTFINNCKKIPMRYFICDDSGSMVASDGHRIMTSGSTTK